MNIAILGGTRFIGPFIVKSLVQQGHKVDVYHRGKTICALPADVRHVTIDRRVPGQTAAAINTHRPEVIIDMCGFDAEEVREAMTAYPGLQQYVFCSSTSVYGKIGHKAVPSEKTTLAPQSKYECGKAAGEDVLLNAYKNGGAAVTILRLAHPYGPGDHLLYSTGREGMFLDRIRQGRAIVIPGDGNSRIHPIYITDAADAFVHVIGKSDCFGRVFNLAGNEILSFDEYFASIAKGLDSTLNSYHIPPEWFDTHADMWADKKRNFNFAPVWCRYESAFDITALYNTGFRNQSNHDAGVAATIAWLDEKGMIDKSSDHDLEDIVVSEYMREHRIGTAKHARQSCG